MTNVPREYLDVMAEFATGVRRWPEWQRWFAVHASRLVRQIDRSRFEQLKSDPERAVATFLREEGVTNRASEPCQSDCPDDPVGPEEYEVYTAVCRQSDLFVFSRPDTVFEDQSNGDIFDHPKIKRRVEFEESKKEYRVVQPGLATRFSESFHRWFVQYPEMMTQYEARNQRRWVLEKRFKVENGYCFVSELDVQDSDEIRRAFCFSRVGFSAEGRFALVFIRYAVCCSYYLVFERTPLDWHLAEFCIAWVT